MTDTREREGAMNRLACIAVIGAALIAAPLPAVGADAGERFMVPGPGTGSCESWTQGREAAGKDTLYSFTQEGWARLGRETWVLGYITALNAWYLPTDRGAVRNLSEGTDRAGLFAWIDNYCADYPLMHLTDATYLLADELAEKWLAAHPLQ